RALDPVQQAREKLDEFRMHAELAAIFEGHRKFGAQVTAGLDAEIARDIQSTIGRLEKSKLADAPIISPESAPAAAELLTLPQKRSLSSNDYHIRRRPGETSIVRFLQGAEVESFYERLQAHFDAALGQFRAEERDSHGWKQDPQTTKYLEALDAIDVK